MENACKFLLRNSPSFQLFFCCLFSLRNEEELTLLENEENFERLMKLSSMAWPTDWFSHLTKYKDMFFHMNPMSVAGDNASFVMDNVEFSKIFVLKQNWTDYHYKTK